MNQLVPFEIEPVEPVILPINMTGAVGKEYNTQLFEFLRLNQYDCSDVWEIVKNKVWQVVGIDGLKFLLVREGEIPQWYPRQFCRVALVSMRGEE